MAAADGCDLGVQLGDGFALAAAVGGDGGVIIGSGAIEGQDLVGESRLKHGVGCLVKELFALSCRKNGNAVQNFSLGDAGDEKLVSRLGFGPSFDEL